jgi:heme/copper-type cytochrome/quinol oxidase subunit 2
MQGDTEEITLSAPKKRERKTYIIVISVLIVIGVGIYGIVQAFDYYYNPGGTIVLNPGEYQHWFLPDSHPWDIQRPRWKGVTNQDTFSVYFGRSAVIENLIANFSEEFPLDAFSEYLLAEETSYFHDYIMIPSAGNWSIIMINPHTYAISVENSLMGLIYPYNIWMVTIIVFLVICYIIAYIKRSEGDHPRTQQVDEAPVAGL